MPDQNNPRITTKAAGIPAFPHRRAYLFVVGLLIIISVFELQFVHVTSITLILFLLAWLPFLIPWLYAVSPRIGGSLGWLRTQGVEEVETSIFRIKLAAGVEKAAEVYENTILQSEARPQGPVQADQLDRGYQEAIQLAAASHRYSSADALARVDELAALYDQIRSQVPSGPERSRLMRLISSTMWSLIPQIDDLPIKPRLLSDNGGTRLSAYKYLEWRPTAESLDVLLSRAIGTLETPFGQYAALLALRRVLGQAQMTPEQLQVVRATLRSYLQLGYSGDDRRNLMESILSTLG
ncbi:MAG TPA: hypothetical protein VGD69_12460 [Herpetosiphonaceae bacterium]